MNNNKAFTLVELMIVVTIFGIIALIAVPNLATGLPKYRIKRAARDMTSTIRAARAEAIKTSSNTTIEFDVDNNRYSINGELYPGGGMDSLAEYYGSGVSFGVGNSGASDECTFTEGDDCAVTFNSRGFLNTAGNSGEIYLTNIEDSAYRIAINAAGGIHLEQWTGSEWK